MVSTFIITKQTTAKMNYAFPTVPLSASNTLQPRWVIHFSLVQNVHQRHCSQDKFGISCLSIINKINFVLLDIFSISVEYDTCLQPYSTSKKSCLLYVWDSMVFRGQEYLSWSWPTLDYFECILRFWLWIAFCVDIKIQQKYSNDFFPFSLC